MADDPNAVESCRALLSGSALASVAFDGDVVELWFDGRIVRALSHPWGSWHAQHRGWRYPEGNSADVIHRFVGRTVDDFQILGNEIAQLSFGEDVFNIPLADETRHGSVSLQVINVAADDRGESQIWSW